MGEEANEERAQQIYEKSMKIEQQFGDVLTSKIEIKMIYLKFVRNIILFLAIIEDETLSDVYDHICEVIDREQSLDHVWIPTKEKL
jgi:hypothetical protein